MYDYIISLPLSPDALPLALGLLGLVALSLFIWQIQRVHARQRKEEPDALTALLQIGAPFLGLLFLGAMAAAFAVIWHTIVSGLGEAKDGPSLGAGTLIAALLGAPFLIWGTILRQKAVDVQKEGHITDRINAAVEMLGAEKTVKLGDAAQNERTVPNIEVRIGGLLSLERIAQDSTRNDHGRDHVRVMEILCAYIRENAKAETAKDFPLPDWEPLPEDATAEERAQHEMWRKARFRNHFNANAREWARSLPKPREDIQLALTIIGRRTPAQLEIEAQWGPKAHPKAEWDFDSPIPDYPVDWSEAASSEEALKVYKEKLNAFKKRLPNFGGYRLDLRGTNLQGADLSCMTLSGAKLDNARIEGADLSAARMERADLKEARMTGANLYEARLEGADLCDARLEGALLCDARMQRAFLSRTKFDGAELYRTRMAGNHGSSNATFFGAFVRKLSLKSVQLYAEHVNSMFGDASVTLPERMTRPDHWPDWKLPGRGEYAFHKQWQKWRADPDSYKPPQHPASTA